MSAEKLDSLSIRFNKKFNKLEGVSKSATLLYAGFISLESPEMVDFYHDFLDYDMKVGNLTALPVYGQYIICIFMDRETGKIFTALKKPTEENVEKYFRNVGKPFEVIINDK